MIKIGLYKDNILSISKNDFKLKMKVWNYTTGEMEEEVSIILTVNDFAIYDDFIILLTEEGYIIKYDVAKSSILSYIGYVNEPFNILKIGNDKVLSIEGKDAQSVQTLNIWKIDNLHLINLR